MSATTERTSAYASARSVADAVLYEGYVLYPYRASSSKNQVRWQWGVVMPADVVAEDPSERSRVHTQVLVDGSGGTVTATIRFLQVQHRSVERAEGRGFVPVERLDVGDTTYVAWDEAATVERDVRLTDESTSAVLEIEGGTEVEELTDAAGIVVGRLLRTRRALRVGLDDERRAAGVAVRRPGAVADPGQPDVARRRRGGGRSSAAALASAGTGGRPPAAARGGSPLPLADRSAALGQRTGRRLRARGTVPRAGWSGRRRLGDDRLADHPLRPPRARAGEPERVLRRARGRRAAQPPHDDALRGREARDARHRPAHGRPPGRGRRDAARPLGAAPRHGALPRPDVRRQGGRTRARGASCPRDALVGPGIGRLGRPGARHRADRRHRPSGEAAG